MIHFPSDINVSKIEFGAVKLLESGGKSVNMRYEGRNLMLELPSLSVPYGLNVFDKQGPPKYSVDLSLRGADDNDEVRAVQDFLESFDEMMIDAGVANATKWLKMTNPDRNVVKAFYTPTLKISKDANGIPKPYPPTMKVSLRKKKDGNFETDFYNGTERDENNNPTAFDKETPLADILTKRSQVTAIIECSGVWFAGGKFGVTWKAVQMRVDSQSEKIRGPAFRSEAPDIRSFVAKNLNKVSSNQIQDEFDGADDDDGASDVLEAVVPAPKPVVKTTTPATFKEETVVEAVPVPDKKVVKKVVKKVAGA
jgi:hypothetical protein